MDRIFVVFVCKYHKKIVLMEIVQIIYYIDFRKWYEKHQKHWSRVLWIHGNKLKFLHLQLLFLFPICLLIFAFTNLNYITFTLIQWTFTIWCLIFSPSLGKSWIFFSWFDIYLLKITWIIILKSEYPFNLWSPDVTLR